MLNQIQKYYHASEMPKVQSAIAEFKKEMGNVGKCSTLEALYEQLWQCEDEIIKRYKIYQSLQNEDAPYIEKSIISFQIPALEKKAGSLKMRMRCLLAEAEGKLKNSITPDMIIRAREYPITELLGGEQRGNYLCINHQEKHPSMGVKNNRVRCFTCSFSGDSIDVKMLLDNCDFTEAVRRLQ